MQSFIVIPARLESTRLKRKLLLRETGKSVLQHTYESVRRAARPSDVIVAADHAEIADEVLAFGGNVRMTDPQAASGTDRVAEVARDLPRMDILVNVQGDEPEISGESIDLVVKLLEDDPRSVMSTLATPIRDRRKLDDPSCVKVVLNERNQALYFSRSAIPHARDWNDQLLRREPAVFFQHIGLYAYRRDFLLSLARLPRSSIECVENLEQLRVLSAGHTIAVGTIDEPVAGIDTAADYAAFVARWNRRSAA